MKLVGIAAAVSACVGATVGCAAGPTSSLAPTKTCLAAHGATFSPAYGGPRCRG